MQTQIVAVAVADAANYTAVNAGSTFIQLTLAKNVAETTVVWGGATAIAATLGAPLFYAAAIGNPTSEINLKIEPTST